MKAALWPGRYPLIARADCTHPLDCPRCEKNTECLTGKKYEIGTLAYSQEIMCDPRSSDASFMPYELLETSTTVRSCRGIH